MRDWRPNTSPRSHGTKRTPSTHSLRAAAGLERTGGVQEDGIKDLSGADRAYWARLWVVWKVVGLEAESMST